MADKPKNFRIKYEVHCKLQNFFDKETIVKKCLSELHAKSKLDDFCKKKYGIEYERIIIKSCTIENDNDILKTFSDIFGTDFSKKDKNNPFDNLSR